MAGENNRYPFPTMPTEHTFKAGHRIVVIVAGTNTSMASATGNPNVPVTLDTRTSKVTLPVVGGYDALAAAGAFTDPTAPVGGTVPATLSLTLGAPAAFGAFTPGIAKEYTASTTATVISSAGDATLTVADPSPDRHRPAGQRHLRPGLPAAGPRRHQDVDRPHLERVGAGHVQAVDRGQRAAAHGHVQQDADVHPEHHGRRRRITRGAGDGRRPASV